MKTRVQNKDKLNPILTRKRIFSIWEKPEGYPTRNVIANGMGTGCPIGILNPNGNGFQTWTESENGSSNEIPNEKHCGYGFRISNETAIEIYRSHSLNRMQFCVCA